MMSPRVAARHCRLLGAVSLAALFQGCVRLPSLDGRVASVALEETSGTTLGRAFAPLRQAHQDTTGLVALRNGRDAFAVRVLLADAAERTIDAQYYVWHDDMTGMLLFNALQRAADRGVRVRLLLDDNNTKGLDELLAALDAHPNIQVRLFNPVVHRGWGRYVDFVMDFRRLNRRMHNKSFTADNQVTIVGGRNIGDEYFGAGNDLLFADLDVMAVGPVVRDVSHDFDRYWASESSYPADRLLGAAPPASVRMFGAELARMERDSAARAYTSALRSPLVRELLAGRLPFEWATTTLLSDDPAKVVGRAPDSLLLWSNFRKTLGAPMHELQLISPYFVPGRAGVDYFTTIANRGVRVSVLTNALEATDVAAVHAGYAKRRKPLLRAGISLFELKRSAAGLPATHTALLGRSASSLHAKTFAVDGARVFVGSFNFDPRSARLNTELGFVIASQTMAHAISDAFIDSIPARAYAVRLLESGELQWEEKRLGGLVVHRQEPGTGFWRRLGVSIMSHLPIEWLL